jgi:NitT/TauT family transport system ATP-binding protein
MLDLGMSTMRVAVGFLTGAAVAILIGLLTGRYAIVSNFLTPIFQLLRPIPPIAFVPIVILWFGLTEWGKWFLVFWGVFFTVWVATHLGVHRADPALVRAARSLGASDRLLIRDVILPSALPTIFVGLRTAISISFYTLVAAELAGAFAGLAYRIDPHTRTCRQARCWAVWSCWAWCRPPPIVDLPCCRGAWCGGADGMGQLLSVKPVTRETRAGQWSVGRVNIDDLVVAFDGARTMRTAVDHLSLEAAPGEFVCILGPSGCGKSTVLNVVAGFIAPHAGRVTIDGAQVRGPGADRGVVFQQPTLFPWKTVIANIAYGPIIAGRGRAEADRIARRFMTMVGLAAFAEYYPQALSGGMQQRVGIARALANSPKVLLMDEPFGSIDAQTRTMMQEVLLGLWEELHTTVLFVTHDIEEAIFLADRVVVMSAGPGRVIDEVPVPLPRPRHADAVYTQEFVRLKRHCAGLIRTESLRAFEQQNAELA